MVRISSDAWNMVVPEVVIEWKSLVGWHPWSWASEVYSNKYSLYHGILMLCNNAV